MNSIVIVHRGRKPSCNDCGKQYDSKSGLTEHIATVHQGRKLCCQKCGKQYGSKNGLLHHFKITGCSRDEFQ